MMRAQGSPRQILRFRAWQKIHRAREPVFRVQVDNDKGAKGFARCLVSPLGPPDSIARPSNGGLIIFFVACLCHDPSSLLLCWLSHGSPAVWIGRLECLSYHDKNTEASNPSTRQTR